MKTYKNIYPKIYTYENLYEAWRKAARPHNHLSPAFVVGCPGKFLPRLDRRGFRNLCGLMEKTFLDDYRLSARSLGRGWNNYQLTNKRMAAICRQPVQLLNYSSLRQTQSLS